MKIAILLSLLSFSALGSSTYIRSGIWTGNDNFSSAPSPYCPCDQDSDKKDCPEEFVVEQDDTPKVCYDEFIESDSRGWAYGVIYKIIPNK